MQLQTILEKIRREADDTRHMLALPLAKAHAVIIGNLAEAGIAIIVAQRKKDTDEIKSIEEFTSEVKHLDQLQMLTGAISSLNELLVEKGIVREEEIQGYFRRWLHRLQDVSDRRTQR